MVAHANGLLMSTVLSWWENFYYILGDMGQVILNMHPKICAKFFEADLPYSPEPLRAIFISRFMGPKDVSSQRTAAQLERLLHIKNYVFAYIIGLETRLLHTARKLPVLCDLASLNKHVDRRFFLLDPLRSCIALLTAKGGG